jgi:hypothetical protein
MKKKSNAINIAHLVLPFILKLLLSVTLYRPAACSLNTHTLRDYRLRVVKLGRPPTRIRLSYGTHTAGNYTCWQDPGFRLLVHLIKEVLRRRWVWNMEK